LAFIGGAFGIYLGRLLIDGIWPFCRFRCCPPRPMSASASRALVHVLASLVTGLLFGCAPAWKATRLNLNEVLNEGGRTGMGGGGRGLRRALVVVEFAMALTLLAGGGLALRSFWNLTRPTSASGPITFSLSICRPAGPL